MLRIGPRSMVVTCTANGPRREKIGISTTAATTPAATQVLRRRLGGRPFELWLFDANRFSFQDPARTTASNNLPPRHALKKRGRPLGGYYIGCGPRDKSTRKRRLFTSAEGRPDFLVAQDCGNFFLHISQGDFVV